MLSKIQISQVSGVKYSPKVALNNSLFNATVQNNTLERVPAQDSISFGKTQTSRYITYPEIMEFGKDIDYRYEKDFEFKKYTMTGDNGENKLKLVVINGIKTKINGNLGDKSVDLRIFRTSPTSQAGYIEGKIGNIETNLFYEKMGNGIRIQKISAQNENLIPMLSILIADKISWDEQMNFF